MEAGESLQRRLYQEMLGTWPFTPTSSSDSETLNAMYCRLGTVLMRQNARALLASFSCLFVI